MTAVSFLLVVALAISTVSGMMGPPPGIGGGPPPGIAAGPPPFVQAIIASKGKPFAGGPPGIGAGPPAMGPPPFVQAIIASKGKPFAGAVPPAPEPAPAPAPFDPSLYLGPPAYIQSLLAAKAASMPFIPPLGTLGPPTFVQQLIAAKNAAAAQAAAQAAADEALLAQQVAAGSAPAQPAPAQAQAGATPALSPLNFSVFPFPAGAPPFVQSIVNQKGLPPVVTGLPKYAAPVAGTGIPTATPTLSPQNFTTFPFPAGAPPFVQSIVNQKGLPPVVTGLPKYAAPVAATATVPPPPAWIVQMIQAQMEKKAMKASTTPTTAPEDTTGPGSDPAVEKRQAMDATAQPQLAATAPAPPPPPQYPAYPFGFPFPPFGPPFPMMPFGPPMMGPWWKFGPFMG